MIIVVCVYQTGLLDIICVVISNIHNTRYSSYFIAAYIIRDVCHAHVFTAVFPNIDSSLSSKKYTRIVACISAFIAHCVHDSICILKYALHTRCQKPFARNTDPDKSFARNTCTRIQIRVCRMNFSAICTVYQYDRFVKYLSPERT